MINKKTIEIIKCTCDVCGKEVESKSDFDSTEYEYGGVPKVALYIQGFYWDDNCKDICHECAGKFNSLYHKIKRGYYGI